MLLFCVKLLLLRKLSLRKLSLLTLLLQNLLLPLLFEQLLLVLLEGLLLLLMMLLEQARGVGLRRRRGRWKHERLLLGVRDRAEEKAWPRLRAIGQRLHVLLPRLGREPRSGEHDGLRHELPLAPQVGRDGDAVVVEVGEGGLRVAAVVEGLVDEGGAAAAVRVVQHLVEVAAVPLRLSLGLRIGHGHGDRPRRRQHDEVAESHCGDAVDRRFVGQVVTAIILDTSVLF